MIDNRKDYKLVLVIGNGFDLDLGLPTSYQDFLKSSEFKMYLNSANMQTNYGYAVDDIDNLFQYLNEKFQCQHWIDIEMELKNLASRTFKDIDGKGNTIDAIPVATEGKAKSFDVLCKQLCLYLKNLDYNFVKGGSAALKLLSIINRYASICEIITFNYTDLHKLKDDLPEEFRVRTDHVHGSIKDGNIIIGFQDEVEIHKSYSFMIKSFNPAFRSHNVRQKLLDADEIIFFGHSLGETDYHYFEDLFRFQSQPEHYKGPKIIRIFTYDEQSRIDILFQLRAMNKKRTDMLFDLNNFEIYRTKDDARKIEIYLSQLDRRLHDRWLESGM